MSLPTIKTPRLTLRQMAMSDVEMIVAGLNNMNVVKWLTVVPYPYTADDARWFITENLEGRVRSWSIWAGDDLVGNAGIEGALGYWLAEPFWGHGYATEAAIAARDYHFASTDADLLTSEYFHGNAGSAKVLGKIGLTPTGDHTAHCKATGQAVQATAMQMTRKDWEAHRG